MDSATADSFDRIADFVLGETSDIPESALSMAATLLIDTIGVSAGAADLEAGHIARDFAVDFLAAGSAASGARLLFDGRPASLAGAAYANATQIDNLDGHDGYNPTKGHIGCAVVPALLAFAEQQPGLSGRQALAAMVIAYEVAARAGIALHATVSDYHTSGAWNALGAAALGCRLMGTASQTLRQAFGIAEYHGPRSQMMREIGNPTMLHDGSGIGAMTGVSAALLAMRGFTGAPALTVQDPGVSAYWRDLGHVWTIENNYIKPYPVCRWSHAAIDATRQLMHQTEVSPAEIDAVEVRTFHQAAKLFPGMPRTTSQAQYSLCYALAALLVHKRLGPAEISPPAFGDADVARLLPAVRVIEDDRHNVRFPAERWSDVTMTLKDGRALMSGDVHARGGPEAPMSEHEIETKFMTMSAPPLSSERAGAIWCMRKSLLDDDVAFSRLSPLVYPPPEGNVR